MLVPVLFILFFIVLISGATLEVGAIAAHVALSERATAYADVALSRAINEYGTFLSQEIGQLGPQAVVTANQTPPAPGPTSAPSQLIPPYQDALSGTCNAPTSLTAAECPFSYTVHVTIGSSTAATLSGPNTSNELQTNYADEQKLSVRLDVNVVGTDALALPLAKRSIILVYRVYNNAPYATLAGARSIDTSTTSASVTAGDSSGGQETLSSGASADTRIHTVAWCTQIGYGLPSNHYTVVNHPPNNEGLSWNGANNAEELPCLTPAGAVLSTPMPTDHYDSHAWTSLGTANTGWSP
jgi:hypothetical protein